MMKGGALVVLILYFFTKYQGSEAKCFDMFHLDGGGRGLLILVSALGGRQACLCYFPMCKTDTLSELPRTPCCISALTTEWLLKCKRTLEASGWF